MSSAVKIVRTLRELVDVSISSPSNGQALIYDTATGKWKNATSSGGGGSGESGYSGFSGRSGFSGYSGSGVSGYSGYSGRSGFSGYSGLSGFSGVSSATTPAYGELVNTSDGVSGWTYDGSGDWDDISGWGIGEQSQMTGDGTSITANVGGAFLITCALSFTMSNSKDLYSFAIFKNGVQTDIVTRRWTEYIDTGSGQLSLALTGILTLAVNDVIDVRVKNVSNTNTITLLRGNLCCSVTGASGSEANVIPIAWYLGA